MQVVHPQHQVLEVTPWSVSYHALYPSVAVQNFTLTDLDKPDGAIKKGVVSSLLAAQRIVASVVGRACSCQ